MRTFLFLFFFGGLCSGLSAQIFGPVAVPVAQRPEGGTYRSFLAVEASGGLNLVTRRSILRSRFEADGVTPGLGWQAGLQAIFFPESEVGLLLGFEAVRDRGTINNYTKTFSGNPFTSTPAADPIRSRVGDVIIKEFWLRSRLGLQFNLGKLRAETAFQVSSLLGGSQQYDYVQTTTALFDQFTDRIVPLETPVVRTGSRNLIAAAARGGYGGLYVSLRYPLQPRLYVGISYEQGWHFDSSAVNQEWRQRRSRAGLGLTYELFRLARK